MYKANKRKLFEKAQLKRQYAKLLKKEAADTGGGGGEEHEAEAAQPDVAGDAGGEERVEVSLKRKRKDGAKEVGETKQKRDNRDGGRKGQREQGTKEGGHQQQGKPGKWRRPEPRPDPFKAAKVRRFKASGSACVTTAENHVHPSTTGF